MTQRKPSSWVADSSWSRVCWDWCLPSWMSWVFGHPRRTCVRVFIFLASCISWDVPLARQCSSPSLRFDRCRNYLSLLFLSWLLFWVRRSLVLTFPVLLSILEFLFLVVRFYFISNLQHLLLVSLWVRWLHFASFILQHCFQFLDLCVFALKLFLTMHELWVLTSLSALVVL